MLKHRAGFIRTHLLAAEFDFTGTSNVELAHRLLELAIHFEFQEGLADLLLEVAGLSTTAFNNLVHDHLQYIKQIYDLLSFITSKKIIENSFKILGFEW